MRESRVTWRWPRVDRRWRVSSNRFGIAVGIGGLAGAYTGARIQSRLPDALIRRLVGILVVAIGARYLWAGLSRERRQGDSQEWRGLK